MIWFVIYYSLTHIALIYDFYTKSYYKIMANKLEDEKEKGASGSPQQQQQKQQPSEVSTPSIVYSLRGKFFNRGVTSQSTPIEPVYKSPITKRRALHDRS
jgi:hypothetical protein